MTGFTGLKMPSIAFDCDGVLTSEGTTTIGQDTERKWDVTPIRLALSRGFSVGVMTCNVVSYVASRLTDHGLTAIADEKMTIRAWDGGTDGCTVLVTNRKLLADRYVDDHGLGWSYGDDPELIFAGLPCPYDYRTIEYRRYAAMHIAHIRGQVPAVIDHALLTSAQIAAGGMLNPLGGL